MPPESQATATPSTLAARFCSTLQRWLLRSVLLLPGIDGVLRELIQWYLSSLAEQQEKPKPQVFGLVLVTSVGLTCVRSSEIRATATPDVLTKAFAWAKELEGQNKAQLDPPYSDIDSIDENIEAATNNEDWASWASEWRNSPSGHSCFPLSWSNPGLCISAGQSSSTSNCCSLAHMDEQQHLYDGKETFVLERTIAVNGDKCSIMFARRVDHGGQLAAIKRIKPRNGQTPEKDWHIQNEIECLQAITADRVPFATPLISSWWDEHFAYIAMPFYYQNMFQLSQQWPESCDLEELRLYFAELVDAVRHIHSLGIIHRDIKCENVFIAPNGRAFLADFGLAFHAGSFEKLQTKTFIGYAGSEHYMAPEVLLLKQFPNNTYGQSYNYKCDIWSLGVIMDNMYSCYGGESVPTLSYHENLFRLTWKMCQKTPSERPDAEKLELDPYFASINWKILRKGEYEHRYHPSYPQMDPI